MNSFEARLLDIVEEALSDPDTSQPVRDWLSVQIVPEVIAELRGRNRAVQPQPAKPAPVATVKSVPKTTTGKTGGLRVKLPGLREARKAAGLSPLDLAVAVDVTAESVANWESGKYGTTRQNAAILAKKLGCTVETLTQESVA